MMSTLNFKSLFAFLASAVLLASQPAAAQLACRNAFGNEAPYLNRAAEPAKVDFNSVPSYITEYQRQNVVGKVSDFFDRDLDTRVYISNNAVPDESGHQPFVDPASRGVIIFLHGSGTARSSGKNFLHIMNSLSAMNVSSVAMDLPFHADGPLSNKFNEPAFVTAWLNKIVSKAKAAGVPVYLAGHSFGPSLIMEYLYDYPRGVDGALLISPVAFNEELRDWYEKETSRMKLGDADLIDATAGGIWGDRMLRGFRTHNGPVAGDPTVLNPDLKVHVLTGDREEYARAPLAGKKNLPQGKNTYSIPDALRKILSHAKMIVESGVGHYIFKHKDSKDRNVVMRELTDLVGINLDDAPAIKREVLRSLSEDRSQTQALWTKYWTDPLFKSWADSSNLASHVQRLVKREEQWPAKRILEAYRAAREKMEAKVIARVVEVAEADPEIAKQYATEIKELKGKGMKDSPLFNLIMSRL
jgi:pimeloyl-ACP methyl ester carboxylesterase